VDEILQAQSALEAGEGLPFWLLWFLLFVIILLVAFIFLRDKDLRRRLSSFLSGARRHMLRLRLQVKLKKEKQKKTALWRELGKKAWNEDFRTSCIEGECARLAALEEDIGRHQKTWHDVYSRIEVLGKEHDAALQRFRALVAEQEEARRPHQEEMVALAGRKREILDALEAALREAESAEAQLRAAEGDSRAAEDGPGPPTPERVARADRARERAAALSDQVRALRERKARLQEERYRLERRLEEVEGRIRVFNSAIQRIEEGYRERLEAREKEIREWQKAKQHVQDKIVGVKRLMEPLFENVGRILDEARIDHEDMAVLYFEIDGVNRAVADIEARLERLK
jgi:chromosome segregation ATPase